LRSTLAVMNTHIEKAMKDQWKPDGNRYVGF
jgi:hypothetical protein